MQDPKPKQEPSMLLPKEVAHVKCFICRPQMAFCSYCALFTKRPFVHPLAREFPTSSPSLPSTLTLYRPTDQYQQPGPKTPFLSLEKLRCQLANETGGRWLGS